MADTPKVPEAPEEIDRAALMEAVGEIEPIVHETNKDADPPVQLTAREQQASELGWMPQEDWVAAGRSATEWRPADIWLDRGEMLQTIAALKREVKSTQQQVAEAYKQGEKIAQAQFTREIDTLKLAKKEAMQNGEFDKVVEFDEAIESVKEMRAQQEREQAAKVKANGPPPEFNMFLQRNPWYNVDEVLHGAADAIGYAFQRQHPNATPGDIYWHVEQTMLKRFPDINGKPRKSPPAPDGGTQTTPARSGAGSGKSKLSSVEAGMTDMERGIMSTLVKSGTFKSKEAYLTEYAKTLES